MVQRTATQSACARILADAHTVEEATVALLHVLGEALGWEVGVLWTVAPDGQRLRCAGVWQAEGAGAAEFVVLTRETTFAAGVGLPGRVWASGAPAWITDVTADPSPRAPVAARVGLQSALGCPLSIHGRCLGVIEFLTRRVLAPDEDLLTWLTSIGQQLAQFMERQRVEASARTTQATHAAIVATALDCIVTIDRHGRIVEFNRAAEETFGYTKAEVAGRLMADVIIPESLRARHRAGLAHYLATGQGPLLGKRIETTALHASGREFPVELTITELPVAEGAPLFAGFLRDISQREETRRAADEARQRASFLAEAGVILSSSLDYETTFANMVRLAVPMFADWCAAHVVQNDGSIRCVALVHRDPDVTATVWPRVRDYRFDPDAEEGAPRVIRTGQATFHPYVPDDLLERMAKDPEDLATRRRLGLGSVIAVPLIAGGRVLGALAFVMAQSGRRYEPRDLKFAEAIAGRAAVAVDNALLYRSVQAANQLKDDFLATLSHELRTPLNSILGWARMLSSGQVGDDQREHAVRVIERSARSQKAIIEDLLDVSRITAGRFTLRRHPDDLTRTIQAALDAIRPAADAKHITLDVRVAPAAHGLVLLADHERLQQVLWNLLGNAVKFTPRDGRVTLHATADEHDVVITVTDTGEGIDPAVLPYVFERFRQADSGSRRRHGGLGLGLAIVRQLTELHGGTVEAASDGAGKGATFSVRLPRGAPATGSVETGDVGPGPLTGVTALLVEDDGDTRELFGLALRAAGASVRAAASAPEALAILATLRATLLVADIGLAGDDGYELLRQARSLPGGGPTHMAAVAFSAYATRRHQELATAAGFDLFLAKPIAPPDFVAAIVRLLDTRR